mmetsp:Transcript_18574/g.60540  ORF Transcript_18574/g.60540 Transcript_18574/m.60540 type:complete len:2545 (+) Transcript_18574:110-7744(+)
MGQQWRAGRALVALLALTCVLGAGADSVAPYFVGGYPYTANVLGTSVDVLVQLNEVGTVYYAVVPRGATAPTSAQVQSQVASYGSVTVAARGTASVATANSDVTLSVTGLTEKTDYDIYVVAADASGNLQATPTKTPETTADDSPPVFASGYPYADNIAGHKFDLMVQLDEAGTFWYVVQPSHLSQPSIQEVMEGTAGGAVACGPLDGTAVLEIPHYTGANNFFTRVDVDSVPSYEDCLASDAFYGLAGLEPTCRICPYMDNQTTYSVYVVAEDDEGLVTYYRNNNLQSSVTKFDVTMADISSPAYTHGYPTIADLVPTSFEVQVAIQELGKAHYVLISMDAQTPSEPYTVGGYYPLYSTTLAARQASPSYSAISVSDIGDGGTHFLPVGVQQHLGNYTGDAFALPSAAFVAPTAQEVFDAVQSADANPYIRGMNVAKKGSWTVSSVNSVYTTTLSGLNDISTYELYVITEDDGNTDTSVNKYESSANNIGSLWSLQVVMPDGTVPVFVGAFTPTPNVVTGTNFDLVFQLDEPGTVYYTVVPFGTALGDVDRITGAGAVACGAVTVSAGFTNTTESIEGVLDPATAPQCTSGAAFYGVNLGGVDGAFCDICPVIESETKYTVFYYASDVAGNLQTATYSLTVETTDVTAPSFVDGPLITANVPTNYKTSGLEVYDTEPYEDNSNLGVTINVTLQLDEPGTCHYLAIADALDKRTPTAADVRSGLYPYDASAAIWTTSLAMPNPAVTYTAAIRKITSEQATNIYVVCEDDEDNRQDQPFLLTRPPVTNLQASAWFTRVTTADITAPEWTEGYPLVSTDGADLQGTQLQLVSSLNEPGTVYFVVAPAGFTYRSIYSDGSARSTPTVEEVKAGLLPGGTGPPVVAGSYTVEAGGVNDTHTVSGLTSETAYTLFVVASDDGHAGDLGPNFQDTVVALPFTTRDITPPTFDAGFPFGTVGGSSVEVTAQLNEVGHVYFLVVNSGATAPTAAQTRGSADGGLTTGDTFGTGYTVYGKCGDSGNLFDATVAGVPVTCTVTGLTPETAYSVYVIAEDNKDFGLHKGQAWPNTNLQSSPTLISITTKDINAPEWYGDSPFVSNIVGSSLDVTVSLSEIGTAYYAVIPQEEQDVTALDMKTGTLHNSMVAVTTSGTISAPTANFDYTGTATGLTSETDYKVFVVAEDDAQYPNLREVVTRIDIRTPDVTPPELVGPWTAGGTIENVQGTSFEVVTQLNEPGTAYFVMVPFGADPPTAADVRALSGPGGAAALACGIIQVDTAFSNRTYSVTGVDPANDPTCTPDGSTTYDAFYGISLAAGGGSSAFYGLGDLPFCYRCPLVQTELMYDVYVVAEDDGGHGIPADVALDNRNLQAAPTRILRVNADSAEPSVLTADTTAPVFTLGTPFVDNRQGTGFNLHVALNDMFTVEPPLSLVPKHPEGYVRYAVVEMQYADSQPSYAQLVAGQDAYGNAAAAFGTVEVMERNTDYVVTVTGLGDVTRYEDGYQIFILAEDDEPTGMSALAAPAVPNISPYAVTENGQEPEVYTVDVEAPLFDAGYPYIDGHVAQTGMIRAEGGLRTYFDISVKMDETGKAYYVAFEPAAEGSELPGSRAPSPAQVKAGLDYAGNPAAIYGEWLIHNADVHTVRTQHVLTDSTVYDVYIVAEDNTEVEVGGLGQSGPNLQSAVTKLTTTTADGTAPLFSGNPCNSNQDTMCTSDLTSLDGDHSLYPRTLDTTASGFTLEVSVNEPGSKVYYFVLSGQPTEDPSKAQVVAGVAYTVATNTYTPITGGTGYIDCPDAGTVYSKTISATLTGEYFVYVATLGPNGNFGDGDVKRESRLNPTKVAPLMIEDAAGDNVTAASLGEHTITPTVTLSSDATAYYVLLMSGSPAPTPTEVFNGYDSNLNTAPCAQHVQFGVVADISAVATPCYFADTSLASAAGSASCTAFTSCALGPVANLTEGTSYDLYVVTKHATANDNTGPDGSGVTYNEFSRTVNKLTFRTPDTTPPFFNPSFPYLAEIGSAGATLVASLDEGGEFFYLVLNGGAPAPTAALVKAYGVGQGATEPIAYGRVPMPAAVNPQARYAPYNVTFATTYFLPDTVYDVYLVAEDDEATPNLQTMPTKIPFRTRSNEARLYDLQVGAYTLNPLPALDVFAYRVFVQDGNDTTTITPVTKHSGAVNGVTVNGTAVASGTAFATGTLAYGKNYYQVNVTAEDGTTTLMYELSIYQLATTTTSNSTLQILNLIADDGSVVNSTNMGGAQWPSCVKGCTAQSPAACSTANPSCVFDAAQLEYTVYLPSDMSYVDVQAIPTSATASVRMYTLGTAGVDYPGGLPGYTTGVDVSTNNRISLFSLKENGGNTIDLVVSAADGKSTTTYTINVERTGPGVYGTEWQPVVPTTAKLGERYGPQYAADDPLTLRVGLNPTTPPLTVIPALDIDAPKFLTSFPRTANVTGGSLELVVQTNDPATVYYIVVANGARAPTAREVKEQDRADLIAAGSISDTYMLTREVSTEISGLSSSTAYDVYAIAEDLAKNFHLDSSPNLQNAPTLLDVTTM